MKTKAITILVSVICIMLFGFSPAVGKSSTTKIYSLYEDMVDKEITKCERKAAMATSKFDKVRSAAEISGSKADYFRLHKKELIKDMMDEQIGLKAYKVQYFLNMKFFATYHQKNQTLAGKAIKK
jgi:hypothetical protein